MPTKKPKTGATPPRRSNHVKPNPKLQAYNDTKKEELLSSDEDENNTSSQRDSDQTGERTGDKLWKILDNDQRTPLQIGVEAPNRLKLRVQNRDTNEIRQYDYKNTDVQGRQSIDWNSKEHLGEIMRWRSQIFNRLGFPIRGTTRWSEDEVVFLTLVFEKLALAVEQMERVILPGNDVIFQLFTDAFGSIHDRSSFDSRIRRKDGSRLAILRDSLEGGEGDLNSQSETEFRPTIILSELEPYKEHGYVRLNFDLAKYQLFAEAQPAVKKGAKARGVVKPRHQKPSKGPVANKTTKKAESKQQKPVEVSAPGSRGVDKPSNDDDLVGLLSVVHPESNIRNDPMETTTDTYSSLAARNKWLSLVMGPAVISETALAQPSDPARQLDIRPDERTTSSQTQDWISQATKDLGERIERLKGDYYLAVARDRRNGHRAGWHADTNCDTNHRSEGAAAVNALLSAAIVPPVGYHSDVRALVKNKALPADQLLLLERHESALRVYHTAFEREYKYRFGPSLSADGRDEVMSSVEEADGMSS